MRAETQKDARTRTDATWDAAGRPAGALLGARPATSQPPLSPAWAWPLALGGRGAGGAAGAAHVCAALKTGGAWLRGGGVETRHVLVRSSCGGRTENGEARAKQVLGIRTPEPDGHRAPTSTVTAEPRHGVGQTLCRLGIRTQQTRWSLILWSLEGNRCAQLRGDHGTSSREAPRQTEPARHEPWRRSQPSCRGRRCLSAPLLLKLAASDQSDGRRPCFCRFQQPFGGVGRVCLWSDFARTSRAVFIFRSLEQGQLSEAATGTGVGGRQAPCRPRRLHSCPAEGGRGTDASLPEPENPPLQLRSKEALRPGSSFQSHVQAPRTAGCPPPAPAGIFGRRALPSARPEAAPTGSVGTMCPRPRPTLGWC